MIDVEHDDQRAYRYWKGSCRGRTRNEVLMRREVKEPEEQKLTEDFIPSVVTAKLMRELKCCALFCWCF